MWVYFQWVSHTREGVHFTRVSTWEETRTRGHLLQNESFQHRCAFHFSKRLIVCATRSVCVCASCACATSSRAYGSLPKGMRERGKGVGGGGEDSGRLRYENMKNCSFRVTGGLVRQSGFLSASESQSAIGDRCKH